MVTHNYSEGMNSAAATAAAIYLARSGIAPSEIRNAISIGGDTIAAIAGGIDEAPFGIPKPIADQRLGFLRGEMRDVLGVPYRCSDRPSPGEYGVSASRQANESGGS